MCYTENTENIENQEYESYVFKFGIALKDKNICGQKYLNIEMFDSCFGEKDTDYYIPIIGTVKETDDLCYGVRCYADNMIFKIYDKHAKKIHIVYIVDNIAVVLNECASGEITEQSPYQFAKIISRSEDVDKNIDIDNIINIVQSCADADSPTEFDLQFALDFSNKQKLFEMLSSDLTSMVRATYFSVINNFLVKYNMDGINTITDNKKVIKMFEKCKDEFGYINPNKYNKLLKRIDYDDWFEMFENVKKQLPNYQVFEEFEETAYDMFSYGLSYEDEEQTYYF